jgi:hypothetical protein
LKPFNLIEGPLAEIYEALSQHFTVIRIDKRGTALTERDASDYSSDETFVVDKLGLWLFLDPTLTAVTV